MLKSNKFSKVLENVFRFEKRGSSRMHTVIIRFTQIARAQEKRLQLDISILHQVRSPRSFCQECVEMWRKRLAKRFQSLAQLVDDSSAFLLSIFFHVCFLRVQRQQCLFFRKAQNGRVLSLSSGTSKKTHSSFFKRSNFGHVRECFNIP